MVTLDEMKRYLRVDFSDDDTLIMGLIISAEELCASIARMPLSQLIQIYNCKIAVMYAVAYLYEHREEADHHQLTLSLRALLESERRSVF